MPWEGECDDDDDWPNVLNTGGFWLNRPATKLYLSVDMASAWSLTTSTMVRFISVLTGRTSSDEGLTSSSKSYPWYSDELGWRETLSSSWAVIISWRRLLVLVTLAVFDSFLSILLRRRVIGLCKSILVSCSEDSGNADEKTPALEGIKLGLFWRMSHALSFTLQWSSTKEVMWDNAGISLSLLGLLDLLRNFVLQW